MIPAAGLFACDDGFVDIDRVSDAIGLAAGVGGVLLIAATWPRRRRVDARRQHPSSGAPFALGLAADEGLWHVAVRDGRPPVTIDILTHRPAGSNEEWNSEEIVEPVAVASGETVQIPSSVTDRLRAHDVVVGWTVQHATGDVQGSRVMRVGEQPTVVVVPEPVEPGIGFTLAYGLMAAFLAFASMVIGLRLLDDSRFQHDEPTLVVIDPVESPSGTSAPATVATTSVPLETAPTTAAPSPTSTTSTTSTTTTSTSTTSTTPTTTTVPTSTTTSTPTTSTTQPTTTVADTVPVTTTAPTTVPSDGQTVVISARVDPCRFGPACLIASFTLVGFAGSGEYVCDFADFDRFTFPYSGTGRDDACAAASQSTTITIEVDGVRSKTVSRESLDGN